MRFAGSKLVEMWILVFALILISCPVALSSILKDFEREITTLLQEVHPSVVTIHSYNSPDAGGSARGAFAFGAEVADTQIGTGVVYDAEGHIVTTGHVVQGGSRFEVFSSDGRKFKAVVVGIDLQADVSVLRISGGQLPPLTLNRLRTVAHGSFLFVLGNSFGIPNAATLGTAIGYREDGPLQVSANLSPGFSGGPVINVDGEMVGLVSAKLTEPVVLNSLKLERQTPTGAKVYNFSSAEMELPSTGVILAVPSAAVKATADRLIAGDRTGGGFLGIQPEDVDPDWMIKAFNVTHGVMITDVLASSPAWKAGIRIGDILTRYLGRRITSSDQLRSLIGECKAGDVVSLGIVRGGKNIGLTVQLTSVDALAATTPSGRATGGIDAQGASDDFDLSLEVDYRRDLAERIDRLQLDVARQMKELELLKKQLDKLGTDTR
ncbi:MAG: S1C family serine protease [candidate division Zixibacteria bacterium]|nr:S1C family serine protease [candidate division Zixibacteria bacterium]MBU1471426.1 S1C family serine protease [candidate division Zixibacteria bacterium]MBU2625330.1 S1C family serine protease [candidate division Zixibacteria bacterium]